MARGREVYKREGRGKKMARGREVYKREVRKWQEGGKGKDK